MKNLFLILFCFSFFAGIAQTDKNIPTPQPQNMRQTSIFSRGDTIYWYGDSYVFGYRATDTTKRFSTIVSKVAGAIEFNYGVGGSTLSKRVPVNTDNMIDRLSEVPTKTFGKKMLVFAFGLNDIGFSLANVAYTTANYKIDYDSVMHYCANHGWRPSQILIIPPFFLPQANYDVFTNKQVYYDWIQAY